MLIKCSSIETVKFDKHVMQQILKVNQGNKNFAVTLSYQIFAQVDAKGTPMPSWISIQSASESVAYVDIDILAKGNYKGIDVPAIIKNMLEKQGLQF